MDFDINDINASNMGTWPWVIKGVAIFIVFLLILGAGYFVDIKKQFTDLAAAEEEELTLRADFEIKQHLAANLDAYKEQMAMMKASFGSLLRQLPEKTQVPGLIEDISHQGLAAGLEFKTIKLEPEKEIDFYIELPIEISVFGNFHQFGEFVSNVASLPRIVTLHDFSIKPLPSDLLGNHLQMDITAKTYRYTAPDAAPGEKQK
jgi:type IV pilus assembly protein PilO